MDQVKKNIAAGSSIGEIISFVQFCGCLLGVLLSVFLWMEDAGLAVLPCHSAVGISATETPCSRMRVVFAREGLKLPFSNAILGMAAFAAMAVILHVKTVAGGEIFGEVFTFLRRTGLALGVVYAAYLILFQMTHRQFCPWCCGTISLWVLVALLELRLGFQKKPALWESHSLASCYSIAFIATVLLGLVTTAIFSSKTAGEKRAAFRQQLGQVIDPQMLNVLAPCGYVEDAPVHTDFRSMAALSRAGNSDAAVVVTLFWDPLCPRCRTLHQTLTGLAAQTRDLYHLNTVPVRILQPSDRLVRALYAAERQKPGNTLDEKFIAHYAELLGDQNTTLQLCLEEAGLDVSSVMSDLDSEATNAALAEGERQLMNIDPSMTTPTVLVNGRWINEGATRTPKCILKLVTDESKKLTGKETHLDIVQVDSRADLLPARPEK